MVNSHWPTRIIWFFGFHELHSYDINPCLWTNYLSAVEVVDSFYLPFGPCLVQLKADDKYFSHLPFDEIWLNFDRI